MTRHPRLDNDLGRDAASLDGMALLLDVAAVARRPSGVVRVEGPDRLSYLHTLLSQHLEDAAAGQAADFLYLDAKGYPIAAGRALVREDHVLLVTAPEVAPGLADQLDRMRFLLQVQVSDMSEQWALASVRAWDGDGGVDTPMAFRERDGGLVVRDRSGGVDLLGPAAWLDAMLAELALPDATSEDWEAWRILHGEAAWGREIAPGHRPQELGLLPTHVHLRKGCYPGQESIAKTFNLGRPRRALAVLELDGEPGEKVRAGGKEVPVTSAAPAGDGWVAMALLPVDADGRVPDAVEEPPGRVLRKVGDGQLIPGA